MGTLNVAPVTPLDYRRLAEKRLPRFLFDYIDGGANDELTMAANIADFQRLKFKQAPQPPSPAKPRACLSSLRRSAWPV